MYSIRRIQIGRLENSAVCASRHPTWFAGIVSFFIRRYLNG